MDLETTKFLLSNTLMCIFVGLQLYHVKKNPKVLPSISLVMLLILALGHMVPLALDSETLCSNKQNQDKVSPYNGGFELNEVIVTVVMVVSLLLVLRLLQLTVSARSHDNNRKTLRFAEEMTLLVIVFLYADGPKPKVLVSWGKPRPDAASVLSSSAGYKHHHPICNYLKSHAGLIMDNFLLPQILVNMFSNSKHKALSRSFYMGISFVRLIPHAYHLYSTLSIVVHNISQFSENPDRCVYAYGTWDVTMFWGTLLLAAIIYFQQKFGGRCIVPFRLGSLIQDGFGSLLLHFRCIFDHLFRA